MQTWLKFFIGIFLVLISSMRLINASAIPANLMSFENNQTIPITLSNTNINRIFISGDKISSISAPSSFVDLKLDGAGGALMSLKTPMSFSAFVSTINGRHFSLLIQPKNQAGQTMLSATHTDHPLRQPK